MSLKLLAPTVYGVSHTTFGTLLVDGDGRPDETHPWRPDAVVRLGKQRIIYALTKKVYIASVAGFVLATVFKFLLQWFTT